MNHRALRLLVALSFIACLAASCKSNPKKKCNTCPKWTSQSIMEVDTFESGVKRG